MAKLKDMGYFDYKDIYDSLLKSDAPELGPIFITRDGRFINIGEDAEHGEIFGDSDYDAEDYYALEDDFGLIKANGGNSVEPVPYIDLWHRPNGAQRVAIVEWLYLLLEHGRKTLQVNSSSDCFEADLTMGIPEEICDDIVGRSGYSVLTEDSTRQNAAEPSPSSGEFELDDAPENAVMKAYYVACDCFTMLCRGNDGVACVVNLQRFANAYCEMHGYNQTSLSLQDIFADECVDARMMSEELVALFFSEVPNQFREELISYLTDEIYAALYYRSVGDRWAVAWASDWLLTFLSYENGSYSELYTVPPKFNMENGVSLPLSSLELAMTCFVGTGDSEVVRCVADIVEPRDEDADKLCKMVSGTAKALQILQRGIFTLPDDSDKFVLSALDDPVLVGDFLHDSELILRFSSAPYKIEDDDLFTCYAAVNFLHDVELPEGVRTIGPYCFSCMRYLNSLFIPKTVEVFDEQFLPQYPCDYCEVLFEGEEADYPADFVTDIKAEIAKLDFGVRFGVSRAKFKGKPILKEGADSDDDSLKEEGHPAVCPTCKQPWPANKENSKTELAKALLPTDSSEQVIYRAESGNKNNQSGIFFSDKYKDAKYYSDSKRRIDAYKVVLPNKIFDGQPYGSSERYCSANHLLNKQSKLLLQVFGIQNFMDIGGWFPSESHAAENYFVLWERETNNGSYESFCILPKYEKLTMGGLWAFQLLAREDLSSKGYFGAIWPEEDGVTQGRTYQIWDLNAVKMIQVEMLSKPSSDVRIVSAFHGSSKDIISFNKPINWVTTDREYAEEFALFAAETGYVYSIDASISDVLDCGDTDGPCYGLRPISPYVISGNLRRILEALGVDEDALREALAVAADEYDEPMGGYRMRLHTFIRSDAFAELVKSLGYRCVKCVEGGHETYGMLYAEDLKITGKERLSKK